MEEKLEKLFNPGETISKVGFTCCSECGKMIWLYLQLGDDIEWDKLQQFIAEDRHLDQPIIDNIADQHLILNTCTIQGMQQNINELSKAIAEATEDKNNLKGRNVGAYKVVNTNDLIFLTLLGKNLFIHLIENGQWKSKSKKEAEAKDGKTSGCAKQPSGNPS